MTHPFRPLFGQEWTWVTMKHAWGEPLVYYFDAVRRMRAIPRAWTSLEPIAPWLQLAAGRSLLRLVDCVTLVSQVEHLTVREDEYLLSPRINEWLPPGHMARSIDEAIELLDLSAVESTFHETGAGAPAYPPHVVT